MVSLCIRELPKRTYAPKSCREGGGVNFGLREKLSSVQAPGAFSSSSYNPVLLDACNATAIETDKFSVLETIPCFESAKVRTPKLVNLDRVVLPSEDAISFASNLHLMGGTLQPFMNFAMGAEAEVEARFRFRDAGSQAARSQPDASPMNRCLAGCRK